MRIPGALMRHQAVIEAFLGTTPSGQLVDQPRTVRARVEDTKRLIRDQAGAQVVSSTTVYVDPENYAAVESMVTVWPGTAMERRAKVISAGFMDGPPMPSYAQLFLE